MGKDVIVALDFDSKEKTLAFLDLVGDGRRSSTDQHSNEW